MAIPVILEWFTYFLTKEGVTVGFALEFTTTPASGGGGPEGGGSTPAAGGYSEGGAAISETTAAGGSSIGKGEFARKYIWIHLFV